MAFPALIVARTNGINVTPLTPDLILDVSSCEMSAILDSLVMASRKTVFNANVFNERDSNWP